MDPALLLWLLLAVTLVLLVTPWVRIEITSMGLVVALALTGLLEPAEALSGFSNPALLTVAAMLVLSAGLEKSGAVDAVTARLVTGGGRRSERSLLLLLAVPTVLFSAFINNTPIVALMIPVTLGLARRFDVAPSRLLLPVSAFSILAGTSTLIGTSTNILVDSLAREQAGIGFGMFEFTGMGLAYLAVGGAYVLLAAPRLLPARRPLGEVLASTAEGRFVTEVTIPAGSARVGRPLAELVSGSDPVAVLELLRGEQSFLLPAGEMPLQAGDALIVESTARSVHRLVERPDVERGTAVADDERVVVLAADRRMAEAVVTPASRLGGGRVRELGLSRKHGIQVLAVRRLGRQHQVRIRDLRLQPGDVLLVVGPPASLRLLQDEGDVLLIQGVERSLTLPRKAPLAVGILAGVVLLAATGAAPIALLAIAGAALMLATRCLDTHDATRALDPGVLLLLAGTIPLGLAMQRTGVAADLAQMVAEVAGTHGPVVVVSALYLLTSLLTEVLSNNAAAVLLTPIALGLATSLGIDPKPLLVAVAFGASASFATPIGYQTNTLVMGPGGYRFADYLRFGLPLNLLMWVAATLLIPIFWSF